MRGILTVLLHPALTMPGYVLATGFGLAWGAMLSRGRIERMPDGLIVARGLPKWAFGRGGSTVGGVFLTRENVSVAVLEHESAHMRQWKRFGLAMIPLYYAGGLNPLHNFFEIQADLIKGGYLKHDGTPVVTARKRRSAATSRPGAAPASAADPAFRRQ